MAWTKSFTDLVQRRMAVDAPAQCKNMGQAKRKREATLNGPCPCGSGKAARACCFNGRHWHKPHENFTLHWDRKR
jgi:hypothetical protein